MNPNFNIHEGEILSPTPELPPNQDPQHATRSIRTFEEDIANAVRDGKGSVLGIALAEQKRKDDSVTFAVEKKNNVWLIVIGVFFILAAIGLFGFVGYSKYSESLSTIAKNTGSLQSSLVESDTITQIDIQKLLPKNGITESLLYSSGGTNLSTRTIQILVPTLVLADKTTAPADIKLILSRLAPHAPSLLTRSISSPMTMGIYAGDTAIPFIIFKANSYEGVFSGMLQWEEFMSDDLFTLLGVNLPTTQTNPEPAPQPITEQATTSTTTVLVQPKPVVQRDIQKFVDRTIKNKDMRVLQDDTGKIYLLYGFVNKDTVIITTAPEAFFEIGNRLK